MISKNYFEFFEMPIQFKLDEKVLKRRYLLNSKKYHPDHYTLESEEKQAEVLELSAFNNEGYKILRDFDKRMAYILSLKGVLSDETKSELPQSFLMEMMDINEAMMELEFDPDKEEVERIRKEVSGIESEFNAEISGIIEKEGTNYNIEELEKVKKVYLKKKYLWRIKENLNRFAAAL